MIIGNPDNFAILIELIDDWNTDSNSFWKEGIFDFIFQNKYLSEEIKNYTLNELLILGQDSFFPPLIMDRELFLKDKESAFKFMLDRYDPYIMNSEDIPSENDKIFDYTDKYIINKDYIPGTWITSTCYENNVRLLGAITHDLLKIEDKQGNIVSSEWVKRNSILIHESIIHIDEYHSINKKIENYLNKILNH